ncbi:MAG TPA: hypothetical protein VFN48_08315 [Solirubrobacteraceae bacterium]|nr:hypothetical protein [Solirubrobacteraceae bacterium]
MAGLTRGQIQSAVRRGLLHPEHRCVYAVGHAAPLPLSRETGALLAVGDALCGVSVLMAHGVVPSDPRHPVDVAIIGRQGVANRDDIRVHRYGDLSRRDIYVTQGLPMTTVTRALVDAADELTGRALERAVAEALAGRHTTRGKLRAATEAAVGRRGRAALGGLVDPDRAPALTHSRAAEMMLALIRQAKLPEPETEVELYGYPADFFFREAGVVLEVDSFGFHGMIRANFERDRRRDRVHRQHGLEVVRATATEIRETPILVIADLAQTIARRLAARRRG